MPYLRPVWLIITYHIINLITNFFPLIALQVTPLHALTWAAVSGHVLLLYFSLIFPAEFDLLWVLTWIFWFGSKPSNEHHFPYHSQGRLFLVKWHTVHLMFSLAKGVRPLLNLYYIWVGLFSHHVYGFKKNCLFKTIKD